MNIVTNRMFCPNMTNDYTNVPVYANMNDIARVTLLGKPLPEQEAISWDHSQMSNVKSNFTEFIRDDDINGLIIFLQENPPDQKMLDQILLCSISHFNMNTAKYVINLGANINAEDCFIACQILGHYIDIDNVDTQLKTLDKLLDMGLDLTLIGLPSIVSRLYDHNYTKIKYVFEHINETMPANVIDTCLHYAIQHNAVRVVELLLSYDCEHALLPENTFNQTHRISTELLQILILNNKIDLKIHGSALLHLPIYDKNMLVFLLENNIEIDGICLDFFMCTFSIESLEMLLEYGRRPTIDDIVMTFGKTGFFIKLVTERGINVYASLGENNINTVDMNRCSSPDFFTVDSSYSIDLAAKINQSMWFIMCSFSRNRSIFFE